MDFSWSRNFSSAAFWFDRIVYDFGGALSLFCCLFLASVNAGNAQDSGYEPRDTYGEVGLLETPSARMADDGEIAFTFGAIGNAQRFNLSFQALPWLEGTFRYSHIGRVIHTQFDSFGNQIVVDNSYYDRSIGAKIRFWQEGDWRPEFSLGIRDLIGTNFYGSEYLVASKTLLDDVDVSAGIGWGRLAEDSGLANPFGWIFQSFKQRNSTTGNGGEVDFGQYFHGPHAGLFGGLVWHTPIDELDLIAEYSGDKYEREVEGGGFRWKTPLNLGLAYRPLPNIILSSGWMYGTIWGATLTVMVDPKHPLSPSKLGPPAPAPVIRNAAAIVASPNGSRWQSSETRLTQALMSFASGVHDVTRKKDALFIEVASANNIPASCQNYARIVAAEEPQIKSLVISDSNDPKGHPTVCPIHAKALAGDVDAQRNNSFNTADARGSEQSSIRQEDEWTNTPDLKQKIHDDACDQSLSIASLRIGRDEAVVYYGNNLYFSEAEAAGRLARILMADTPPAVERFDLILMASGIAQREFRLSRSALERAPPIDAGAALHDAIELRPAPMTAPGHDDNPTTCHSASTPSRFLSLFPAESPGSTSVPYSWSILPEWQISLFDPTNPVEYQIYIAATGSLEILPGLTASATLEGNVYNGFRIDTMNNSLLPHVRSDIGQYLKHGANGIGDLLLTYRTRLAPDIFAEFKEGYLESMFFGGGGQILWRPDTSRLMLGADLYDVKQRGFDRLFDFNRYHTLTGHVSLYYRSPWYGLNFNVHAGRYLAGDYGATFEATRRFSTGVEIGAFATFTNVPFSKFGEGSFDKGILISIPLEWGLPYHSTSTFDFPLHSLTRDGGQRLDGDDSLYGETKASGYYEIEEHLDDIANP